MKKLVSKLSTMVVAFMIAVTCLGAGERVASAANTGDTNWGFTVIAGESNYHFLSEREKTNDSFIYFAWLSTYGGNASKIFVSPYSVHEGVRETAGTRAGGVRKYIVHSTGRYFIKNYVFERNKQNATLGVKGYIGNGGISGKWSPDSVGSYPILQ